MTKHILRIPLLLAMVTFTATVFGALTPAQRTEITQSIVKMEKLIGDTDFPAGQRLKEFDDINLHLTEIMDEASVDAPRTDLIWLEQQGSYIRELRRDLIRQLPLHRRILKSNAFKVAGALAILAVVVSGVHWFGTQQKPPSRPTKGVVKSDGLPEALAILKLRKVPGADSIDPNKLKQIGSLLESYAPSAGLRNLQKLVKGEPLFERGRKVEATQVQKDLIKMMSSEEYRLKFEPTSESIGSLQTLLYGLTEGWFNRNVRALWDLDIELQLQKHSYSSEGKKVPKEISKLLETLNSYRHGAHLSLYKILTGAKNAQTLVDTMRRIVEKYKKQEPQPQDKTIEFLQKAIQGEPVKVGTLEPKERQLLLDYANDKLNEFGLPIKIGIKEEKSIEPVLGPGFVEWIDELREQYRELRKEISTIPDHFILGGRTIQESLNYLRSGMPEGFGTLLNSDKDAQDFMNKMEQVSKAYKK